MRPQEAKLLLCINIKYYSSVSFILQLYIFKPRGQSPGPRPAPSPLYFILSTEQRDSFKMLEVGQSGWTRLILCVSSSRSLSPDSFQLVALSVMKAAVVTVEVVGGSGEVRDEQRSNV